MKQQVWTDCRLATLAFENYGQIQDGALALEGDRILWVGRRSDLPDIYRNWKKTEWSNAWITPGLIDCHTHLVYAGHRSQEFEWRLQGQSYAEILKKGGGIHSTVQATRAASEDDLRKQSAERLKRLQSQGVTTVEIKSGYGLDFETELKMLRVAKQLALECDLEVKTTFLGAHVLPKEFRTHDDYMNFMLEKVLPVIAERKLADAVDVFCEGIAFNLQHAERLFQAAEKWKLQVKMHAEQLSDQGGAQLAAQYGALSVDHLEYLPENRVSALAKSGTVAVLLPGAFYFLQETQKPPVQALRQHGVPMAIATDCNPGSSPTTSLPLMMSMACLLFDLTPEEAWWGVTRHAAKALGLNDRGTLEVGKRADLAVWDFQNPIDLVYEFGSAPLRALFRGAF